MPRVPPDPTGCPTLGFSTNRAALAACSERSQAVPSPKIGDLCIGGKIATPSLGQTLLDGRGCLFVERKDSGPRLNRPKQHFRRLILILRRQLPDFGNCQIKKPCHTKPLARLASTGHNVRAEERGRLPLPSLPFLCDVKR